MDGALKVEIWSDVVCPWCYIGKCRFERALELFERRDQVEVAYRSFELNPNAPHERHLQAVLTEFIGYYNHEVVSRDDRTGVRTPAIPSLARRASMSRPWTASRSWMR